MKLEAKGVDRIFFRNGKGTNFFHAVHPTDLILEEGKLTEIAGRSGSGKTTFTNMLAGLLKPTEGSVIIGGEDIYSMTDKRLSMFRSAHIGVVPQGQTGLSCLTVLENVCAPAMMYSGDPATPRAIELLTKLDIADLADVYSNELSGGELRRMSIARAMINSPEILIADEPTSDLDDDTTKLVMKLLRSYADGGASVLIVTHEKDALEYADVLCRMDKGVLKLID